MNEALLAEIKAGRIRPIAPIHFWMNMAGMAAGGFFAAHVIGRGALPVSPGTRFSEKFFLERAEMIASILIQGLRPERPTAKGGTP